MDPKPSPNSGVMMLPPEDIGTELAKLAAAEFCYPMELGPATLTAAGFLPDKITPEDWYDALELTEPLLESACDRRYGELKELSHKRLIHALAYTAEYYGMTCAGVASQERILLRHRIPPKQLTGAVIHNAEELLYADTSKLLKRYNKAPEVPADLYDEPDPPKPQVKRKGVIEIDASRPFGLKRIKLIQWMGWDGWTFAEARRACGIMDLEMSDTTIRLQLTEGANSQGQGIPRLTPQQALYLWTIAD